MPGEQIQSLHAGRWCGTREKGYSIWCDKTVETYELYPNKDNNLIMCLRMSHKMSKMFTSVEQYLLFHKCNGHYIIHYRLSGNILTLTVIQNFGRVIRCTHKVQSLIVLLLKRTRTNTQTCSPSLQPWGWRTLRFKVISSIQQPGALHCQCIT